MYTYYITNIYIYAYISFSDKAKCRSLLFVSLIVSYILSAGLSTLLWCLIHQCCFKKKKGTYIYVCMHVVCIYSYSHIEIQYVTYALVIRTYVSPIFFISHHDSSYSRHEYTSRYTQDYNKTHHKHACIAHHYAYVYAHIFICMYVH